jgi:hypothetical protein
MDPTPAGTPFHRNSAFKHHLRSHYWDWFDQRHPGRLDLLDTATRSADRPPVFSRKHRDLNVIVQSPGSTLAECVLGALGESSRHRWFGSMNSSQALAQSVFANLQHHGRLDILARVLDDDGQPVFFTSPPARASFTMEARPLRLGEPSPTSVDVFIDDATRIAVECKFTEPDIGTCSRPDLLETDPDVCDGSYSLRGDGTARCPLTSAGVRYWDHLPGLFGWDAARDHDVCPTRSRYQLARNLLAATVRDGRVDLDAGLAVLVYDERNPAFQPGGAGFTAWRGTRAELLRPSVLRRASWQQIVGAMRWEPGWRWLTDELTARYGL